MDIEPVVLAAEGLQVQVRAFAIREAVTGGQPHPAGLCLYIVGEDIELELAIPVADLLMIAARAHRYTLEDLARGRDL